MTRLIPFKSVATKPSGRIRRARGFTLIEMMIVVAIAGIMTTLSVVLLRDTLLMRRELTAARSVAALVKRARIDAIGRHERVQVNADTAAHTITLMACRSKFGADGLCVTAESLAIVPMGTIKLNDGAFAGVRLTSAPAPALVFGAAGFPEITTTYTFVVDQPERPGAFTVTVTAAGEVRVQGT